MINAYKVFGFAGYRERNWANLPLGLKIACLEANDIDEAMDEMQLQLKQAGIDKVIAEANRQLAEWRKTNP